jgi:hypothetical protein
MGNSGPSIAELHCPAADILQSAHIVHLNQVHYMGFYMKPERGGALLKWVNGSDPFKA